MASMQFGVQFRRLIARIIVRAQFRAQLLPVFARIIAQRLRNTLGGFHWLGTQSAVQHAEAQVKAHDEAHDLAVREEISLRSALKI
jgi:hypothetical protein